MIIGHWRGLAMEVIEEALTALPPDADEATCRKVISAAYPFGERAMYPYKAWLSAVNDKMALRFHRPLPGSKRRPKTPEQKRGEFDRSAYTSLFLGGEHPR